MGPKIREAVLRLLSQELHLLPETNPDHDQPNAEAFKRTEGSSVTLCLEEKASSATKQPGGMVPAHQECEASSVSEQPAQRALGSQQDKGDSLAQESMYEQQNAAASSGEEPQADGEGVGSGYDGGSNLAAGEKGSRANPGRLIVPRDVLLRWVAGKDVNDQD